MSMVWRIGCFGLNDNEMRVAFRSSITGTAPMSKDWAIVAASPSPRSSGGFAPASSRNTSNAKALSRTGKIRLERTSASIASCPGSLLNGSMVTSFRAISSISTLWLRTRKRSAGLPVPRRLIATLASIRVLKFPTDDIEFGLRCYRRRETSEHRGKPGCLDVPSGILL